MYTSSDSGDDLMFLGHVAMDLKNGEHVAGEFTGRFELADTQKNFPRIRSYSVWAVSSLMWSVNDKRLLIDGFRTLGFWSRRFNLNEGTLRIREMHKFLGASVYVVEEVNIVVQAFNISSITEFDSNSFRKESGELRSL